LELKGKYTVLMISHRLSTIKNADIIYYIKNSEIIAQGDYNQIVDTSREFKQAVSLN